MKKVIKVFLLLGLVSLFAACSEDDNPNTVTAKPAKVPFYNASSYKVDVYWGFNPDHFDPTTLICTINSGDTKIVELYPTDDTLGEAFFPRYKIRLADSIQTGNADIYVDAQRVLTNLNPVLENGKTAPTQTIPRPNEGDLNYFNGYIIVHNQSNTQISLLRGTAFPPKMNDKTIPINPDSRAYYEIEFSYFDTSINMNQLKAFSDHDIPFPVFNMERGKKYEFTVQGDTVTGPVITPLPTS